MHGSVDADAHRRDTPDFVVVPVPPRCSLDRCWFAMVSLAHGELSGGPRRTLGRLRCDTIPLLPMFLWGER
jgi:hypothetical protein